MNTRARLHTRPSPSTDLGVTLYLGDKAIATIEPVGSPEEPPLRETDGRQHYTLLTLEGPDAGYRLRFR